MKAKMHIELKCEECSGQLSYHKDVFIKCNTLKCSLRGQLFHGPSIELQPVEKEGSIVNELELLKAENEQLRQEAEEREIEEAYDDAMSAELSLPNPLAEEEEVKTEEPTIEMFSASSNSMEEYTDNHDGTVTKVSKKTRKAKK